MLFHKSREEQAEKDYISKEVKIGKAKRKYKHRNSKLRHPIKAVKRGRQNVHNTKARYQKLGRQRAERIINHKPTDYYVPDREVFKDWSQQSSPAKKIITAVIIIAVVGLMVLGAMS